MPNPWPLVPAVRGADETPCGGASCTDHRQALLHALCSMYGLLSPNQQCSLVCQVLQLHKHNTCATQTQWSLLELPVGCDTADMCLPQPLLINRVDKHCTCCPDEGCLMHEPNEDCAAGSMTLHPTWTHTAALLSLADLQQVTDCCKRSADLDVVPGKIKLLQSAVHLQHLPKGGGCNIAELVP